MHKRKIADRLIGEKVTEVVPIYKYFGSGVTNNDAKVVSRKIMQKICKPTEVNRRSFRKNKGMKTKQFLCNTA
jgi:hypothetical protein